jgi:hypothetical protein
MFRYLLVLMLVGCYINPISNEIPPENKEGTMIGFNVPSTEPPYNVQHKACEHDSKYEIAHINGKNVEVPILEECNPDPFISINKGDPAPDRIIQRESQNF